MTDRPTLRDAFTGENLIGFCLMMSGFAVLALFWIGSPA